MEFILVAVKSYYVLLLTKYLVKWVSCNNASYYAVVLPLLFVGNTIPEPHTEDGIPGWAIGVLIAAIVVTVIWVFLLVALVSPIALHYR